LLRGEKRVTDLFFSVVYLADMVAVGLGSNKEKLRRAGYVALALTGAIARSLPLIRSGGALYELASSVCEYPGEPADRLRAPEVSTVDGGPEREPEKHQPEQPPQVASAREEPRPETHREPTVPSGSDRFQVGLETANANKPEDSRVKHDPSSSFADRVQLQTMLDQLNLRLASMQQSIDSSTEIASPHDPLNWQYLNDLMRRNAHLLVCLDPSRDASAQHRWARLVRWFDITDDRLRNTHGVISATFRHGSHGGQSVEALVQKYLRGEDRPEYLTTLVAVEWSGKFFVVFGNRRLHAVKEFARRMPPLQNNDSVPKVRVIVHRHPFQIIRDVQSPEVAQAFLVKVMDAMSSTNGGLSAEINRRR